MNEKVFRSNAFQNYASRIAELPRNIMFFLLGSFLLGIGQSFLQLFLNLHLRDIGLSDSLVAKSQFLFLAAGAAGTVPALFFISRLEIRPFVNWSVICTILSLFLAILLPFGPLMLFFFGLSYAAMAAVRVASAPFLMQSTSVTSRPYAFSLLFIGTFGSSLVGNLCGGLLSGLSAELVAHVKSFNFIDFELPLFQLPGKYGFAIISGQLIALLSIVAFGQISSKNKSKASSENPSHNIDGANEMVDLANPKNWKNLNWKLLSISLIPHFLISTGAGLVMQFLNLYLVDTFQINDQTLGLLMGLQSLTMIAGVLFAPYLAEKLGSINTIMGTQLLSLPFMLLLAFSENWYLCSFALVIRAMLMNMSSPISDSYLLGKCSRTEQSVLNALKTILWTLSWAIGSLSYAYFFHAHHSFAFVTAAVLYLLATFFFGLFFHDSNSSKFELSAIAKGKILPFTTRSRVLK